MGLTGVLPGVLLRRGSYCLGISIWGSPTLANPPKKQKVPPFLPTEVHKGSPGPKDKKQASAYSGCRDTGFLGFRV